MYENVKKAVIYARYSSSNQTEQSIEGQVRVCTEFCQRQGITIVDTYIDRATSASKDIEKRVEFLRMIKDSEKHPFDAVIVYKLDRFARNRYDSANYKFRLKKNGVQLISATENISQDPEGIILESVLEGMAEFYSAELGQKINRGLRESAYKNQYIGGTVPLGYKIVDKKFAIDEETAPYVREAFQRFVSGETVASICRSFNARGIRTVKNSKFGRSSFVKMFRNEKYIGNYQFHDYKSNCIPPIIDMETWEKVQTKLSKPVPSGTYKAKQIYLLSQKVICGKCGSKMTAGKNSSTKGYSYSYYMCSGKKTSRTTCDMKNIKKEVLEEIVLKDAYSMLTDETIEMLAETAMKENEHELETNTHIPELKQRITVIKASLDNLTKAIEIGAAPDALIKRMMDLEKEKKELEAELRKEERDIPIVVDKYHIIYWLQSLRKGDITDPDFQKQLIDLFVNSVTVWDDPEPGVFTVTIAYNLSNLPTKTYKTTVGFEPQTSRLEVKSDWVVTHSIRVSYRARKRASKGLYNDAIEGIGLQYG